jgi:sigma-B regulation protein RsbU (phosphoserine phosphatase)
MKIRNKFLLILLIITLIPLIAVTLFHTFSMNRLGINIAQNTRSVLTQNAKELLVQLASDFEQNLDKNQKALEMAVKFQARELERRLSQKPPSNPDIFFSTEYKLGSKRLPGLHESEKHIRFNEATGEYEPVPVSYQKQVYLLPPGVSRESVASDLARLSTMPKAYSFVHQFYPDLLYWQYTALESGIYTCYPGHGGYPFDYDPRKQKWYKQTKKNNKLSWFVLPEITTQTVTRVVAEPIYSSDGSFAGVTAIDIPFLSIFKELQLPESWSRQAATMLVTWEKEGQDHIQGLKILVHESYQFYGQYWLQQPVQLHRLISDDPEEFKAFLQDIRAGKTGVRKMQYRGQDTLWAYAASNPQKPFPVIILPHKQITAQANSAQKLVRQKTSHWLQLTTLIFMGAILLAISLAFWASHSITRPLTQLSAAAQKLTLGDYKANVQITTRDELQELGEIFNSMGPKLEENERMHQALTLAKETQQYLLPKEPPALEQFDIAGKSIYSDETGGDYYDFIELVELKGNKLGIAVGDITGHGLGAALLMASARGALRSHAERFNSDLRKLFQMLNLHLVRDTGDAQFLTLFYGILNIEDNSLSWISAGHDPGIWLRYEDNSITELPNTGMPLGILDEAQYDVGGPVVLKQNDILVIGTDGIWEARNMEGEMFGQERINEILFNFTEYTAKELCEHIINAVKEFRGERAQEDDITLVIIKMRQ